MLVQFMLKNFMSFRDEAVLDMRAVNSYKEHPSNIIDIEKKEKYLSVAAIYGANASGKSNMCIAMKFFQNIIAESLNNVADGETSAVEYYYEPYKFNKIRKNSEFEIIIVLEEFEYQYGFEYNEKRIETEWIYRKNLNTNRKSVVLERTKDSISFGPSVKKECKKYQEQIPSETLALTFFNRLNLETNVFGNIYSGIMQTLVMPSEFCEDSGVIENTLPIVIDNEKEKLMEFLSAIDSGIKDVYYDDTDDDVRFYTKHKGEDGEDYNLPLHCESEGTIKSIGLFIYARIAVLNDYSMFIDELNVKLHPLLLKFIVNLFYEEKSKAQLIYTTHDTTLMDKRFFRRDQIFFVQKDKFGYSNLSALSDFKVRSDASFEKDYLAGVFGGIPNLKEFKIKEGK